MITKEATERFWSKVEKHSDTACWLWQGARTSGGYGHLRYQQHDYPAHRFAFLIAHGPIPDGYCVCHRCDVRNCVNPAHLFLGTKADNTNDMWSKGRGKHQTYRGDLHPKAKLTDAQVIEIRRLAPTGVSEKQALADRFGVCLATINVILRRSGWKHVPDNA